MKHKNTINKIKVLVVDDSAVARNILIHGLRRYPFIEIIGSARDSYEAMDMMHKLKPDVMTLDVEMPGMDGLTFLTKIMSDFPMPVIMVSSLTKSGCDLTISCLETGAVDFVAKPDIDAEDGIVKVLNTLADKIRFAAMVKVLKHRVQSKTAPTVPIPSSAIIEISNKIIAIGASTGGTEAIKTVLTRMPANAPAIVITQHMPEKFTKSFADRLNDLCKIDVREAKNGDRVIPGLALIAHGNFHMTIKKCHTGYCIETNQDPLVNGHRPSIDVMFESVAKHAGNNSVGVIMTGMGIDGAKGLLTMRENGARTFAQNEDSCIVFGMPKTAIELGAAEMIVPLNKIADEIFKLL